MAKIFINYRRKDSAPYAGRLYDRLAGHFGHDHVFMDIDQIEPGEVFDQVIQEKLKAVQAAVVLIGAHWLDIADANGQRRLDDPDDWVRLEIAALLERNIRVIPVLVGGAALPKSTQLPECLVPLTRSQAIEITDHRFHADADKLIKTLEKIMGVSPPKQPESLEKPDEPGKPGLSRFVAIAGAAGIVLAAGIYFGGMPSKQTPFQQEMENQTVKPIADTPAAETKPVSTKAPAAEQPQPKTPEPTVQPVTEQTKVSITEPEMVRIAPGKFLMGSPETEAERYGGEEGPQHEVTIAYAFEIGKYEVTFDEYDAFASATKRKLPDNLGWSRGKRPVVNVSWNDAQAYVKWLSEQTGKRYRLPTEAEWEYAARAGTQTRYWWGDDIGRNNAVCNGCGSKWDNRQTAPAGSFKANAFGLHDTAGNVWEWTQDCWHKNYSGAPADGSAWLEKGGDDCNRRVVRGGSWGDRPRDLRSAIRGRGDSDVADDGGLGFRIARAF